MSDNNAPDHPTHPTIDDIRQLRIFYNGKELLNSSKIKSAVVVEKSAEPIEPVLQIMASSAKSSKAEDDVGEFSCSCRIL